MTVSYTTISQVNTAFDKKSVPNPVGVFTGSTSGIGEHLAYSFAKTTVAPSIYIVGRNTQRGENVKANIAKLNPAAKVTFLQADLSLIKQAKKVADVVAKAEHKVNVLSVSQGELLYQKRTETSEGIDEKLAVGYYARWAIIRSLIDLVQVAATAGEPARVLTVQGAGYERIDDFTDLEMKRNYSFTSSMYASSGYNSLSCLYFARKYPQIAFTHSNPGLVKTKVGRSLPFYLKAPVSLIYLFARSPEMSGEYHLYEAYTGPEFATGAHIVDEKLNDVSQKGQESGMYSVEHQDEMWKHAEGVIERVLNQ